MSGAANSVTGDAGAPMPFERFHHTTLDRLLAAQASAYPDRAFLTDGDERWTYAQAQTAADSLAGAFRRLGLEPGDRLAVLLPNLPAFVLALFAAAKARLLLVPINVRRSRDEVRLRLARTRPKALIGFSDPENHRGVDHLGMIQELRGEVTELQHLIAWGGQAPGALSWAELVGSQAPAPEPAAQPQDPAAIIHTLGSSGQPRGAVLAHSAMVRNAAQVAEEMRCTEQDVFLGTVPFSNTFGLTPTILACTVAGAELVCLPRYSPGEALRLIAEHQVTVHHGVPTMFALELNHPEFDPARVTSLRAGAMAGAPCPPELVRQVRERMGFEVLLAYGLTEASPSVTMTRFGDGPVTATETVGRPHPGISLKVIDLSGTELLAGEEGELCVKGYNVMLSYWEDPQATAQAVDPEGWLHTGDLARIDPDGPVHLLGRKDEVINRAGFKIHPGMVEMGLRTHPAVREAAVVGIPDALYGEISCACLVLKPGANVETEALLAYAGERLPDYAIPDRVLFFDHLPRSPAGPVRRDYLRERVRIRGRAWKFGKNIDTDAIIPARHCNTADPAELAKHCMEDADPSFVRRMRRGDVIVAESNFGCGSSREVAPISIKAAGVSAVVASSFARIFFRNAINIGLPILECPAAVEGIQPGDELEVEPASGTIRNLTRGQAYQAAPYPEFLLRIIQRGGLLAYVEERLAERSPQ